MLENLKREVYEANMMLPKLKLVKLTWGNVSGIDRKTGLVAIKPSGVEYEKMTKDDIVIVDLEGKKVEGDLNPSSDLLTHLVLYKKFQHVGGIVHTHSKWATIWAQAGYCVPAFGTTHADYFSTQIPCSRPLTSLEISGEYEKQTGDIIIETFGNYDYSSTPGVLVHSHGPFTWGKDSKSAVENSLVLEEVCKMAYYTTTLNKEKDMISKALLDKHYYRKHGKNAYYGQ